MAESANSRHCRHLSSLPSIFSILPLVILLAMAMAPTPGDSMVTKGRKHGSMPEQPVDASNRAGKDGVANKRSPKAIEIVGHPKMGVLGGGKYLGSPNASVVFSKVGDIDEEVVKNGVAGPAVKRASDPADAMMASQYVSVDEWAKARSRNLSTYIKPTTTKQLLTEGEEAKHPEGDVINLPPNGAGRAALFDRDMRWPLNTVYYTISGPFTDEERSNIVKAMDVIQEATCLRFVGRPNGKEDYIDFVKKGGCYSSVGRQKTRQELSLGFGCLTAGPGIAMHEIMHALGFFHEQSRPDRDNFVTVMWDSIRLDARGNFEKYAADYVDTQGIPYDYGSIMHYGKNAFIDPARVSPDGATIQPKDPSAVIGQRVRLSENDIKRIRKYYNCDGTTSSGTRPEVCANNHETCPEWAKAGECQKNPAWMLRNCHDSCGICSAKGGCIDEDKNNNCPTWAAKGECDKNPAWMLRACRLSCKNCNPMWSSSTTGRTVCQDSNTNCSYWSRTDECTNNPAYMLQMCKRSCNNCV